MKTVTHTTNDTLIYETFEETRRAEKLRRETLTIEDTANDARVEIEISATGIVFINSIDRNDRVALHVLGSKAADALAEFLTTNRDDIRKDYK